MNERIKELAGQADEFANNWFPANTYNSDWQEVRDKKFAELIRADEREAIAQMFEGAPALVQFAQNDQGGCLVCGFTPKLVIEAIRARGTT